MTLEPASQPEPVADDGGVTSESSLASEHSVASARKGSTERKLLSLAGVGRARATALTLVNWKGVFYERYLLDRHVTALEGANGAGKTTVMIAAYVVLLPDLSRLRFTNLGETGATAGDKGIWGRLGDISRPSYAALQIETPTRKLLFGVLLERKTEPTLQITPFCISGYADATRISDILLCKAGDQDSVPTLSELKENVTQLGAQLEVFSSAKEYFAKWFELGISPLRLASDEERNKWNEMLRTSMTGGISRALTSELRSFVLKQETGLSDTLTRMRGNLSACRKTRTEVSEARLLEHEISGIFDAGRSFFASGTLALQARSEEANARFRKAEQELDSARAQVSEHEAVCMEHTARRSTLSARVSAAEATRVRASERVHRLQRVKQLVEKLAALEAELRPLQEAADTAQRELVKTQTTRSSVLEQRSSFQLEVKASAEGLANLQLGVSELHKRAFAYRQAVEHQARLEKKFATRLDTPEARAAAEARVELELQEIDAELARRERLTAVAKVRGDEYREVAGALKQLLTVKLADASDPETELNETEFKHTESKDTASRETGSKATDSKHTAELESSSARGKRRSTVVSPENAYSQAKAVLQRMTRVESLAARAAELSEQQKQAAQLGVRQLDLRRQIYDSCGESFSLSQQVLSDSEDSDETDDGEQKTSESSAHSFASWLHARETACRTLEEQARREERELVELVSRLSELERVLTRARQRQTAFEKASQLAVRVRSYFPELQAKRDSVLEGRAKLYARRSKLEQRVQELQRFRESTLEQVVQLESGVSARVSEVAPIADELEGELLSRRFDELELDAARELQARLGSLLHAVVVEDPEQAARSLGRFPLAVEEVHLVRAGIDPAPPVLDISIPGYLATSMAYGVRLAKIPDSPTLGDAGRREVLRERKQELEVAAQEQAESEAELQQLSSVFADLDELEPVASEWALGDPSALVRESQTALDDCVKGQKDARQRQTKTTAELGVQRSLLASGRALLPELYLLELPNQTQLASSLGEQLHLARSAEAELSKHAAARKVLQSGISLLLEAPPADSELANWEGERKGFEQRRDEASKLRRDLRAFATNQAALSWSDAERALSSQVELVPELQAAHEAALIRLQKSETDLESSEKAWEAAAQVKQQTQGRYEAAHAHAARFQSEIDAEGESETTSQILLAAELAERLAAKQVAELGSEAATIAAESGRAEERAAQARARFEAEARREKELAAAALPAQRDLDQLVQEVTRIGLLHSLFDENARQEYAGWSSEALSAEARGKFGLLCDRLETSRGGGQLVSELRGEIQRDTDSSEGDGDTERGRGRSNRGERAPEVQLDGQSVLGVWQTVRAWLSQRVPARVAEAGDPLSALQRLRDDLRRLETRLTQQETDLRGNSEDVGRNIDLQTRKASTQVRRLNQYLESIRFGSIGGIRVRLGRIERMDQVLHALRSGAAQALLFQSNLPIEEALEEIFRRYGGGKGGGSRLLDYREYLDLAVEVQRQKDGAWELVNPSRLSTGEAIGVGAALMMVVLTEWERDANLLRAERSAGTLRFLFLDEANRLSRDNLGTLFELCQTLDLQLLIAAPEVAHVDGNTTYRLVRRITEDGREEVVASGRRATLPAEDGSARVESVV